MAHHDQSTSFNQSLQTQKVLDSKSPGRAGKNGETHRQDACATKLPVDAGSVQSRNQGQCQHAPGRVKKSADPFGSAGRRFVWSWMVQLIFHGAR